MIPILNKEQINDVDNHTIRYETINSNSLMERAGTNCYKFIKNEIIKNTPHCLHIFCGVGNNGGDGLVIARIVNINKVQFRANESSDFLSNEKKLINLNYEISILDKDGDLPNINNDDFIIDAIWGIGLSRPITNFVSTIISHINSSNAFTISIDIPSGLPANPEFKNSNSIINSDVTITFEIPKLSFLLPNTGNYVGDLKILSIGLNKEFIFKQDSENYFIDKDYIKSKIKRRASFSH